MRLILQLSEAEFDAYATDYDAEDYFRQRALVFHHATGLDVALMYQGDELFICEFPHKVKKGSHK